MSKKKKQPQTFTAWRAVHPDLRSSRGYRWPFPGNEAVPDPDGREFTTGNPCPKFPGDGLCLAKTWAGAASGGIPAITCLEVTYDPADVLGEDEHKIRVSRCHVVEVFDASALIRGGWMAGANLSGSNLSGTYLSGSNLSGTYLSGSNLSGSNLSGSNLSGSNLYRADLYRSNLSGSNLSGSNLSGTYLSGSNLSGANLSGAYGRADWDALVERGAIR